MTSSSLAARREPGDVAGFQKALGQAQLLSQEAAEPFLRGFPGTAVVEPGSTEEVQAVMMAAARNGVTVIPAGAGSWLPAGGWASGADVVLSTRRLDAVTHYEPADLTATVGAGLPWTTLQNLLGEKGQWLPLDPPGVMEGTVGGVVAAGVSGSLRDHFGATRDTVLGLEVVTGDGRRLEIGGRVVKNVAGYDLVRLWTGSRGSLGVITRVSVRLFPQSPADVIGVFTGPMDRVLGMARAAATAPVPIASIELLGGDDWSLAVRLLGGTDEVRDSMERVVAALGQGPSSTLEGEASAAFQTEQTRWEDGAGLVARLAAFPALLDRAVAEASELTRDFGGDLSAHVSQGIVRVRVPSVPADRSANLARALASARSRLEELGGGLTLSTAPHELAREVGFTGGLGSQTAVTERVRRLFDPGGVLASRCP